MTGIRLFACVVLAAAVPLPAERPVRDQDIQQYLNQTITWYRAVSGLVQSPANSRESTFAAGLRQNSTDALRLAFEFARAQAAIPSENRGNGAAPGDTRSRNLAQAEATVDQRADQLQTQIEEANRALQAASARTRPALLARRDKLVAELNLAKARLDSLHGLMGFLASPGEGGLTQIIADLERSIPEAAAGQKAPAAAVEAARSGGPQDFRPESAGIAGLTTQIFSTSRRMSRLAGLARATEVLRLASQQLRAPLRSALQDVIRRGDAISRGPDSDDPVELASQRKELDALLARYKQLSASSAPLSQHTRELDASRANLVEWRGALSEDYSAALRYLLLRLGMLAVAIGVIFLFSELWRRGTMRYVQDLRRRRQVLLLRRIVVGCTIALFVVLSFVTEFGSLATFAGFSAAGIAVAMQSVLLSVVAYFFLVGRWGVRVGDRVTVSGVTGDVIDIGLFRLFLMELGGSGVDLHPTGRVVVFPNAVFFQPAALFKQFPGINYTWRAIVLVLDKNTDYQLVESRLLNAVQAVFAEYREAIERQHKTALTSLGMETAVPRPESRVRLVEAGLEFTIRYPVEIGRAGEIDDRITRDLVQAIESEPGLKLAGGSGPRVQTVAG
jgi:small-conductance mechanosensitive channel